MSISLCNKWIPEMNFWYDISKTALHHARCWIKSSGVIYLSVCLIGGSDEMTEWFSRDNTEGFDEETLKVMNEEMQKMFDSLSEEDKENKSYIDHLKEQILSKY